MKYTYWILLAIACVVLVDGSTNNLKPILEVVSCLHECDRKYEKCLDDIPKKSCPYLSDPISGEEYCHHDLLNLHSSAQETVHREIGLMSLRTPTPPRSWLHVAFTPSYCGPGQKKTETATSEAGASANACSEKTLIPAPQATGRRNRVQHLQEGICEQIAAVRHKFLKR
ncbi:hypothetical protein LSAT2_001326 [Lamellibrachia satsuma]|nr:hypothetical protein LSAT2_001326 [Lamellibrachia satsuma]